MKKPIPKSTVILLFAFLFTFTVCLRVLDKGAHHDMSTILHTLTTNKEFPGIVFEHAVPTTFLQGETFNWRGYLANPNPSGTYLNLIFMDPKNQTNQFRFNQKIDPKQTKFSIFTKFEKSGTFVPIFFAGSSGTSSHRPFKVIPSLASPPTTQYSNAPSSSSFELRNDDLYVKWANSNNPELTKITFSQAGTSSITYLLSNQVTEFKVPFADFKNFKTGATNVEISQASSTSMSAAGQNTSFSTPITNTFNALPHRFSTISSDFTPFSLRTTKEGSITLKGSVQQGLQNQVVELTPSQKFIETKIGTQNPVNSLNQELKFNESGVYILQVNYPTGQAAINTPIYVGDGYPLLPDFKDLNPSRNPNFTQLAKPTDLASRRDQMLKQINAIRAQFKQAPIYLDDTLNSIAQAYSERMARENFTAHVDPQGNGPAERAKAGGVNSSVGENIGYSINLTEVQLGLERSNGHLSNMVKSDWTRVGLGITQNSQHYYIVNQLFSSRDLQKQPLSSTEFTTIKTNLVNLIQKKNPKLTQDANLSSLLTSFVKDGKPLNQLWTYLSKNQFIYRQISAQKVSNLAIGNEEYVNQLQNSGYFVAKQGMAKFGVGTLVDPNAGVSATILFYK